MTLYKKTAQVRAIATGDILTLKKLIKITIFKPLTVGKLAWKRLNQNQENS